MRRKYLNHSLSGVGLWPAIWLLFFVSTSVIAQPVRIVVRDSVLHTVDSRLFGHFLEKPSWGGETGIEAGVLPGTRTLRPELLEKLQSMTIPVLRFPGGTDVDHMDWTDMIDGAPGRTSPGRPTSIGHTGVRVTNFFGYDEALRLAETLGAEMNLVVNFGDCYLGRRSTEDAARHAAALVAYVNAPVGEALPDGLDRWPALRARNGRPEPYGVRYVQIANEPWVLDRDLPRTGDVPDSLKARYFRCLEAYVSAIRSVDPAVEIIADGNVNELAAETRARLGDRVQYVAYHHYKPWAIKKVLRGGAEVPPAHLTDEEVWNAWVAVPEIDPGTGESVFAEPEAEWARASGYPVAVTEWNWNGWWALPDRAVRPLDSDWAKGIGGAGFLHALMRAGDRFVMANQSMLVGRSWGITGIHTDTLPGSPTYFLPSGQVTDLYAAHHGNRRLDVQMENQRYYEQPYQMNTIQSAEKVAVLDVLVTRSDDRLYVHLINRRFAADIPVALDLSPFGGVSGPGMLYSLVGPLHRQTDVEAERTLQPVPSDGRRYVFTLPKRSVSVLEIPLTP